MAALTDNVYSKVLEYLKKEGQVNTFRLAREVGIERHKILNIIKKLEEKGALEFKTGKVKFLKFPSKEKKAKIEVKKALSATKIRAKSNELSAQRGKLREKTKLLGSLQYENKKLKDEVSELESGIKRQHYNKSKKFREQDELIEKLENRIKALQEKAKIKPKIITRKIEVPKIITKTIVKRIIKRVPVEVIKKVLVRVKEREAKPKEFKLPKINMPGIKNIQQLERPKFLEHKIRVGKFNFSNFSGLNKNIQQLHIPKMLRNN